MSQSLETPMRAAGKASRRRILQQEGPVLAAIAVLLSAWLVLALSG